MPKRRAPVDSEDEGASTSETPASKRARNDDSDVELEDDSPQASRRSKQGSSSKGKGRARFNNHSDDDDEDVDEEIIVDKDEEEEKFEAENEERIRRALEAKRKIHGVNAHSFSTRADIDALFCSIFFLKNRGLLSMESSRLLRCISLCATNT